LTRFRKVPALTNKVIKIQIFGYYFNSPLFLAIENEKCFNSQRFFIQRSDKISYADIYIVHYFSYNQFIREYLRKNIPEKKILIIVSLEPPNVAIEENLNGNLFHEKFFYWIISYYRSSFFSIPNGNYIFSNKNKNDYTNIVNQFGSRKNACLIIINECHSSNNLRFEYIQELQNYFSVDVVGGCVNKAVPSSRFQTLLKNYKFSLAFENSLCYEYTTNKYWDSIQSGAIPIVMGFGKNLSHLIPNSFINIFDFETPKLLAQHLNLVSSNVKLYSQFHQWRSTVSVKSQSSGKIYCELLTTIIRSMDKKYRQDSTVYNLSNQSLCLSMDVTKSLTLLLDIFLFLFHNLILKSLKYYFERFPLNVCIDDFLILNIIFTISPSFSKPRKREEYSYTLIQHPPDKFENILQ
ncbi:hypothetical protein HZS_2241, partial [Henneguya salminicola]